MQTWSGGSTHIIMPNFLETGLTKADILQFFKFLKIAAAAAILDFWNWKNFYWLFGWRGSRRISVPKFRQNQLIGYEDIKIFRFFKMAAAAFLDFQICEILLDDGVWRAQTHNWTKCRQNRSFRCGDIAIFCRAYLDHSQWVLVGLYHSAKFGYDRYSSFYNMNIWIFDAFGWKMPIHPPQKKKIGQFDPQNGCAISTKAKKGTPLREFASFEQLNVKMWWTVWPVDELLKGV